MLEATLVRKNTLLRLLGTLLDLLDHTEGAAVPVPRVMIEELVTLLGTSPQRRCLVCERYLLGTTKRRYCRDACRSKAMRLRQGWTPRRKGQTPIPDLWDEMAVVLKIASR